MMEQFVWTESLLLINLLVISKIHNNIIVYFPPSILPSLHATKIVSCIHTPFSMYTGITWFYSFYNGFIVFTNMDKGYTVVASTFVWLLAVIGFAWTTTGVMSKGRRDGVLSATIAWYFYFTNVN